MAIEISSSPLDNEKELSDGFDEELSEEDSEEEKKHIRRSPVLIKTASDYIDYDLLGKVKYSDDDSDDSDEEESDEELVRECDVDEVDWGAKFVLRKRWRTITKPTVPRKIYFKYDHTRFTNNVLHDPEFPLTTFSKFAVQIYNDIQETEYEYVGLVKAYMRATCGFHYYIRFRARRHGQDDVNFQASVYQEIRRRKTNVIPVRVYWVYPLPPC